MKRGDFNGMKWTNGTMAEVLDDFLGYVIGDPRHPDAVAWKDGKPINYRSFYANPSLRGEPPFGRWPGTEANWIWIEELPEAPPFRWLGWSELRRQLLATTALATVMGELSFLSALAERNQHYIDVKVDTLLFPGQKQSIRSPKDDPRQKPVSTANGRGVILR